jgi:hypothetical protein
LGFLLFLSPLPGCLSKSKNNLGLCLNWSLVFSGVADSPGAQKGITVLVAYFFWLHRAIPFPKPQLSSPSTATFDWWFRHTGSSRHWIL